MWHTTLAACLLPHAHSSHAITSTHIMPAAAEHVLQTCQRGSHLHAHPPLGTCSAATSSEVLVTSKYRNSCHLEQKQDT